MMTSLNHTYLERRITNRTERKRENMKRLEDIANVENELKEIAEELEKLDNRKRSYMNRYMIRKRELHLAKRYLLAELDELKSK